MTDSDILIRLGRNLSEIRSRRNLSAAQIGEMLGISADAVRKYERGDRELGIVRLVRAHKLLDCSYMSMLDGLDSDSGSSSPGREFNVLSPTASSILADLATNWDGDIEALIVFIGMVASWPEENRREFYLQGTIINDQLLASHTITPESQPPGMQYMLSGIGKLYDK